MKLDALLRSPVDARFKGVPGGVDPFPLSEIAGKGWNVLREDLPLPLAILKEEELEHNARWMMRFLELWGAELAPHGKTTMAPQLFRRQLDHGAWAITLANPAQCQVARHYGCSRILLANQLVGRAGIRWVADELRRDPSFDFYCLVDSPESVAHLVRHLEADSPARPLQVLVEGGYRGGRSGARELQTAVETARAVREASSLLVLRGVEGFEGIITADDPEERDRRVATFLDDLVEVAVACAERGLFGDGEVILSAGGSAFFDLVVKRFARAGLEHPLRLVVRSGCYLTHDSRMYEEELRRLVERTPEAAELGEGLRPALEVWAYVQSIPERGRAILTAGKRDVSYDYALPDPRAWFRPGADEGPRALDGGHRVSGLNDQHAYLDVPDGTPLRVGDMVALGISHPCATFDRWSLLPVVDPTYNVVSAVRTFF